MPRKLPARRAELPKISDESVFNEINDGPYKDKAVSLLQEFDTHSDDLRSKRAKQVQDGVSAAHNMWAVTKQKIPKSHLRRNFHDYLNMIETKSRLDVRESFQTRVNAICDLRGADRPQSKQDEHPTDITKEPLKNGIKRSATSNKKWTANKIKVVATSDEVRNGESNAGSKTRTKAVASSSASAPRRSLRKGSRTILTTPATNGSSTAAYKGGFTPKFDPRLPITPAQGLRKPHAGERIVLMSQAGSPLSTEVTKNRRGPAIVFPQMDGKSITISSDTILENLKLDAETKESLRVIQQKLSSIAKMPLSK